MTTSDSRGDTEGLLLEIRTRGRLCTEGGTLSVQGGDGTGFVANFTVAGGALDELTVISPGVGYTYEQNLQVVVATGGVGCDGMQVSAHLRSLRLSPIATTVVVSRIGREGLAIANGTHGPFYDFSLEVASDAGSSEMTLVEQVTIQAFPARLRTFTVVQDSVTAESVSVVWSPSLALRLWLSFDGGVSFVRHPASPFSFNDTGTHVESFINILGVQEGLAAGATYIMKACPYDATRALAEQQRPDGCGFLQVTLASDPQGVTHIKLLHVNSTSVSLQWSPPSKATQVQLVYALEVAVIPSLPPTAYSPQFFRIGAAWQDIQDTATSFTFDDLAAVAALGISTAQHADGDATTTAVANLVSTTTSSGTTSAADTSISATTPSPAAVDALAAHLDTLTSAFGGKARVLGTLDWVGILWFT